LPKPRGEDHHSATISLKKASKLKAMIAGGESVSAVAKATGVPYQTLYRLGKGATWPDATPPGDVIGDRSPARGPGRKLEIKDHHRLWNLLRKGAKVAKVASKLGMSESTVRRLRDEFEAMLAHRVSRLHLTSGSHVQACKRFSLTMEQAEALDNKASGGKLPSNLSKILEEQFPPLEKQLLDGGT
jgi:transposase-like protein